MKRVSNARFETCVFNAKCRLRNPYNNHPHVIRRFQIDQKKANSAQISLLREICAIFAVFFLFIIIKIKKISPETRIIRPTSKRSPCNLKPSIGMYHKGSRSPNNLIYTSVSRCNLRRQARTYLPGVIIPKLSHFGVMRARRSFDRLVRYRRRLSACAHRARATSSPRAARATSRDPRPRQWRTKAMAMTKLRLPTA